MLLFSLTVVAILAFVGYSDELVASALQSESEGEMAEPWTCEDCLAECGENNEECIAWCYEENYCEEEPADEEEPTAEPTAEPTEEPAPDTTAAWRNDNRSGGLTEYGLKELDGVDVTGGYFHRIEIGDSGGVYEVGFYSDVNFGYVKLGSCYMDPVMCVSETDGLTDEQLTELVDLLWSEDDAE